MTYDFQRLLHPGEAMRSASGVFCVLLMLVVGDLPTAQADAASEGTGPLYTVEALRAFELFGIHLGMKREEARKALAAAGLTLQVPKDLKQEVVSEEYRVSVTDRPGSARFFGVEYQRWPGRTPRVSSFTYYDYLPPAETEDLPQQRAELLTKFGPPSYWSQWSNFEGGMLYSAAYVPRTSLVDERARSQATSCMIGWNCVDGEERAGCRKKMEGARVPIVQVSLSPQSKIYMVVDYEAKYAELSRAPGFHSRHAEALCPVSRVH
jgi:hypothetical protein